MTPAGPLGVAALAEARTHCAAFVRENARDQWLGALYAPPERRDALLALAAFDSEIRLPQLRTRDPNLAALRLAWWRGVVQGERDSEAAGNPTALALMSAVEAFSLPRAGLEAMLDARLEELVPSEGFDLAAFTAFAAGSDGARLRLAARICGGGRDPDAADAAAPAGLALALTRMLLALPAKAGSAPTLFPVDVALRHGATTRDLEARLENEPVVTACAEARALARDAAEEAERRLEASPPAILPAFVPLGAVGLDLEQLERGGARPFDPTAEASPLRRQWAIWRWARRQ
ncbi:MAG TPA: squalene/phytoene synthase family protein [Roseiarcus sp.]|nr:squalene/phytoene synthase family protein [Roseiarcus sp.]